MNIKRVYVISNPIYPKTVIIYFFLTVDILTYLSPNITMLHTAFDTDCVTH